MDLSGLKLRDLDILGQSYGVNYAYYAAINGLFMGLAAWKMFEIYWWGKDHAEKLRSSECDGELIPFHNRIEYSMTRQQKEPR